MADESAIVEIRPNRFPWYDYSRYTFSLGLLIGSGTAVLSGHTASEYDPATGRIVVRGRLTTQLRTAYAKIEAILEAGGVSLSDVVHVVEYVALSQMDQYSEIARIREEVLGGSTAQVSTVWVTRLTRPDAVVEVEVLAHRTSHTSLFAEVVYLPSITAPSGRDVAEQVDGAYARAIETLKSMGLSASTIVRTLDHYAVAALDQRPGGASARLGRLGDARPAGAAIGVGRLRGEGALFQLDVIAHRDATVVVGPGSEWCVDNDYSAAVRAGPLLFGSALTAADPAPLRAPDRGSVAEQAQDVYRSVIRLLSTAGLAASRIIQTVEYVVPAAVIRYREVADVRAAFLQDPFPASTGAVVDTLFNDSCLIAVVPTAVFG